MDESVVYRKSGRGAARLAAPHGGGLSALERNVLILLDGQRSVFELSAVFDRDALQRLIPELEAQGLAKRVDPELAGELAGAVTQFRAARHRQRRRPVPPAPPQADGHPLFWSLVLLALTLWSGHWLTNRYENQAQRLWQFVPEPPVDWSGVQAATDATAAADAADASRTASVGPASVAPISRLPLSRGAANAHR